MRTHRGFTFVEILTVIAIVTILAGLTYSIAGTAIEKGRQSSCVSRLHQVYIAMDLYCLDNAGWERPISSLDSIRSYAPKDVFRCPTENSITPTNQGLYPAQVLMLQPNSWTDYPISYAYINDYGMPVNWNSLLTQPHVGVIACQWHGSLKPGAGGPALRWLQPRTGPVLRICFDGHLFVWQRRNDQMIETTDVFYWPDVFSMDERLQ